MTSEPAVLLLGTVMLAGCGAGLMLIHGSNPMLKGLNWMGTALVFGGAGAGLQALTPRWPATAPLANLAILIAFLCCYRADCYLIGLQARLGRVGAVLLSLQGTAMLLEWTHRIHATTGVMVLSILAAVQLVATARMLQHHATGQARLSAQITISTMYVLAGFSLLRGVLAVAGLFSAGPWAELLNLLCFGIFIAFGVALAFAFFWRTTTKLSVELEHMASTDPLTRVYNRRVFLSWCASEQSRSERLHTPFSLLMLDFDHFKQINDTYGHHTGDQVLVAAVERIQDSIRGIDVLCRWGGEEFTVLLPNASEEATLIVAERVRRNIRQIGAADPRFADEVYAGLEMSASIGTATYEGDGDSFDMMLQRADGALYEAKHSGRNRVVRSIRPRAETALAAGHLMLKTP